MFTPFRHRRAVLFFYSCAGNPQFLFIPSGVAGNATPFSFQSAQPLNPIVYLFDAEIIYFLSSFANRNG
jgi:hypothetical protein